MNCAYCGFFNEEETSLCGRCGADMPEPSCSQCGCEVEWGQALCAECVKLSESADKTPCPSCSALNTVSAEYCTACGSPMAVITQVMTLSRAKDREPLETWRVYGIETKMVGRDDELEQLSDWLDLVIESGQPKVVSVTGPTGLGKSRLLAEFQRRLDESFSEAVFMQAASRDESGGPFSMFARLLRNRFYIGENDHPDSARRKFVEAVESIMDDEQDAERVAHLVGHLIGMQFTDSPYVPDIRDSHGAQALDQRSFEAVVELLSADSKSNPIVVVLEDLQYATTQSGALIDHLTKHTGGCPVLFLLSWNPDEVFLNEVLRDFPIDEAIELAPLSDREVRDFVRTTLHKADEVPDALVEKIVDASHGNPLSVEEMLRILISQGHIDTRKQTWRIQADRLDEVDLPTTVEATVRARLHALTAEERRVLEMAAVIGESFWPELVRCLYRLASEEDDDAQTYWSDSALDDRVDDLIESLERKDMVRRRDDTSIAPFEELYFKHRIEREAIYEQIEQSVRTKYHRLVAQWLQREAEGDTARLSELIARHYDRGEAPHHAAQGYLDAADKAARRYANRKAVDLYTRALAVLDEADIERKLDAFHDLGSVYDLLGEFDESLAYFREMLRYAWLVDDRGKGGAAYNKIGRAYRSLGEYSEALDHFEQALALFRDEGDVRGIASTLDDIGQIRWMRGQYDEALKYYSAGLQLRRELDDARSIALSLNHIGTLNLARGDLKEAMVYFREALELRKQIGDRQGVAETYNNLAALCMERGQHEQAVTLFTEALEIARAIGYSQLEAIVHNNLGELYLDADQFDAAGEHLERAREAAVETGNKRILFDSLKNLGRLAVERSDRDAALERLAQALGIAEALESQALVGIGKHSLADIHATYAGHPTHGEQAEELAAENYREALELLEEVGSESQLGRCLMAYGNFLVNRGQTVQGRKQLELAGEIFKRLEMRKLWEANEQKLAGLSD